jgi:hypothetical protein
MTTNTTATFLVEPIPPQELEAVRRNGRDTAGDPFRPFVAAEDGAPLRCCLREARAGERIALIAYRPPDTSGAYAEIGPVFVHAEPCAGYPDPHAYPEGFRHRAQVQRGYDAEGRIADAIMVEGATAETGIARLFADPDIVAVHSRNVLYGCYMFAVHRV